MNLPSTANLAGVLALSLLVLTLTLNHQSPDSYAEEYKDFSIQESQEVTTPLQYNEPTWSLRQPTVGSLIQNGDDLRQFLNTQVWSDGQESTADAESILWMQMAIDSPDLLQDSQGTSVSKREFVHGLNMPWKVTGNL